MHPRRVYRSPFDPPAFLCFFQAEDGIRDLTVTGVQTCALPILRAHERGLGAPLLRHRIEHLQVMHPVDLARPAELGVVASMQPIHALSDMAMAERFWGERTRHAYAWRAQLDAGARLAFGSDAPVESPNPFRGLHAALGRRGLGGSRGR